MTLKFFKEFRDDQSGGILAFTLIMFMVMVVGGGMAVDFINYEYRREGVQDALDRGVLAAAGLGKDAQATSLAQIATAEAAAIVTVNDYVRAAGYDPQALGLQVTPNFTLNSQMVAAVSNFNVDTYFLRIAGIETLAGGANSTAVVSRNDIELSLVVDISGSMAGTKIADLRNAAGNFVAQMLDGNRANYTSISLIPFSGQVSASTNLINQFNYNRWHNYSNCVNFEASDYLTTNISRTASLTQTQHFAPDWIYQANSDWCPRSDISIVPLSNDLPKLTTEINALRATGMTATYMGMKWATALLDPDAQPVVSSLIALNDVDVAFQGRPVAYSNAETLKFIILMTDGTNTPQYAVKSDPYRVYSYSNGQSVPSSSQINADYWENNRLPWSYSHLYSRVNSSEGDVRLQNICTQAKNAGIIVFTIGYDVAPGSNASNQMRSCASTYGHFYNVETDNLNAAFSAIAQTIQKLKLVN